jgi:hypothetical protein
MMQIDAQNDRGLRAARNQSLFRALNQKLESINEVSVQPRTETFRIACECADVGCVEMLDIDPLEYQSVRTDPRRFIVLAGHIYPEVEIVVLDAADYVVVEKFGAAGEAAESFDHRDGEV